MLSITYYAKRVESNSYPAPRFFEGVLFKRLTEYKRVKYSIVRPQSDKMTCFEKNCSQNNNNNESFLHMLSQMSLEENYAVVLLNVNFIYRPCHSTYSLVIP